MEIWVRAKSLTHDAWKPSIQLHNLLSGKTRWEDADPAIQSWASHEIHRGALDIIGLPDIDSRRAILAKIPETVRPHVEAEIKRLWGSRNQHQT